MRYLTLLLLLIISTSSIYAQNITRSFHNTPLVEALKSVSRDQTKYSVDILSDNMTDLRTSVKVNNMSVLDAVELICKGQPVKVKVRGNEISIRYKSQAKVRPLSLRGKVYDKVTHLELPHAMVLLMTPEGQVIDSCEAISYMQYGNNPPIEHSDFRFSVPNRPANYVLHTRYVGYQLARTEVELNDIYKRELERELPPVYLKRNSKTLDEVVIVATKVQFCYKGDTLVFNADAFELAEGSMLDALVKQLPGVELKEGGRIYHNGKYVDRLLLNGKDFFRGDNTVMLDNLPAYTVKEVQIYDKLGEKSEFLGYEVPDDKDYVMDIKLKREYNIGTLVNVEAGGGTDERWMSRIFALRFSDHSRIAAYASANNLNGDSKPGENGNWNPQQMQNGGMKVQQQAGLDYNIDSWSKKWEMNGNIQLTNSDVRRETNTNRQNYLASGDTYDRISHSERNKNLGISTNHRYYHNFGLWNFEAKPSFSFSKFDNSNRSLALALYQNDSVINRNIQRGISDGKSIDGDLRLGSTIRFRHSPDALSFRTSVSFAEREENTFIRQTVEYPDDKKADNIHLNRYNRSRPDRSWSGKISGTYDINISDGVSLHLNADYWHKESEKERSVFDLDTIRPFGVLPSSHEYEVNIDRRNSYVSNLKEDAYTFHPRFVYNWNDGDNHHIWTQLGFPLTVHRQRLDYLRGGIDTTIVRSTIPVNIWDCFLNYTQRPNESGHACKLSFQYIAKTTLPDMHYLVDMKDDVDRMNIRLGNSHLRNAIEHELYFSHQWGNANTKETYHKYAISYTYYQNAFSMGSQYDRNYGIRTWRADNINGNYQMSVDYTFNTAVGKKNPLRIYVHPELSYYHSVDLMDLQRSTVYTHAIRNNLNVSYKFGKHSLRFNNSVLWQRFTSRREDFQTQHPLTVNSSMNALIKLPWKMELSTDLSIYTRTGYADDQLNTSDMVWNARLSRPFCKGKLVIMFDGFDILRQLDNVTRTVNAQGRTETYTNVMPRYVLLHAVYRFSKYPKK